MDEEKIRELAMAARAGDPDALAELFDFHRPRVLALCRRLMRRPEDAEDAASEVYLKMHRVVGQYDPAYPFMNWLLRVTGNHCLDRLRRRGLEARLFQAEDSAPEPEGAGQPSPLAMVLDQERSGRLRSEIDALPERYRLPLALRYFNDMSYAEIAEELGTSANRVATLIFRAKKALRIRCASWKTEWMQ